MKINFYALPGRKGEIMRTYFAFINNNKQKTQSPDYFVFLPKEEQTEENAIVGIMYRNKSKKDSEYLKVILKNQEGDLKADVIYFGFKNNRDDQEADWDLFLPKNSASENRKSVGQMYEHISRNDKEYLRITIFDDADGGKSESDEIKF